MHRRTLRRRVPSKHVVGALFKMLAAFNIYIEQLEDDLNEKINEEKR